MSNALLLIVQLLCKLLGCCKDHQDCPDGICDEPLALGATLDSQLRQPTVSIGVFDLFKLLRCVPMDRVMAVLGRVKNLFKDCDRCPDGDCSLMDLLACLDLGELVDIVKEVLSIIKDSTFCVDGDQEITLGQAAAG